MPHQNFTARSAYRNPQDAASRPGPATTTATPLQAAPRLPNIAAKRKAGKVQERLQARLYQDMRLTAPALAVGLALAEFANNATMKSWPSQATLSRMTRFGNRTIYNALKLLVSLGVIQKNRHYTGPGGFSRCTYTFTASWYGPLDAADLPARDAGSNRHVVPKNKRREQTGGAFKASPARHVDQDREVPSHDRDQGPTCSSPPAREPDTTSAPVTGKTLHVCEDCGNQWPVYGRHGETYGTICNNCGPKRGGELWHCDECDRDWPIEQGSVCVRCDGDAAADMGPHLRKRQQIQEIAEARDTGKAEGQRLARQQHAAEKGVPARRDTPAPQGGGIEGLTDEQRAGLARVRETVRRLTAPRTDPTTTTTGLVNGGAVPTVNAKGQTPEEAERWRTRTETEEDRAASRARLTARRKANRPAAPIPASFYEGGDR